MNDRQKSIAIVFGVAVAAICFFLLSSVSFGTSVAVAMSPPVDNGALSDASISKFELVGTVLNGLASFLLVAVLYFAKAMQLVGRGLEGLVSGKAVASPEADDPSSRFTDDVADAYWRILEHAIETKDKGSILNAVNALCGEQVM